MRATSWANSVLYRYSLLCSQLCRLKIWLVHSRETCVIGAKAGPRAANLRPHSDPTLRAASSLPRPWHGGAAEICIASAPHQERSGGRRLLTSSLRHGRAVRERTMMCTVATQHQEGAWSGLKKLNSYKHVHDRPTDRPTDLREAFESGKRWLVPKQRSVARRPSFQGPVPTETRRQAHLARAPVSRYGPCSLPS